MTEDETSTTKQILTGILQGSALGPLLYLIYIQFLKTYHFADDTTIAESNKSLEVLAKQLNKDLSNISYWLRPNKLCLHVQKK